MTSSLKEIGNAEVLTFLSWQDVEDFDPDFLVGKKFVMPMGRFGMSDHGIRLRKKFSDGRFKDYMFDVYSPDHAKWVNVVYFRNMITETTIRCTNTSYNQRLNDYHYSGEARIPLSVVSRIDLRDLFERVGEFWQHYIRNDFCILGINHFPDGPDQMTGVPEDYEDSAHALAEV